MPKIPVTEYVLPFGKAETRYFVIPQNVKEMWECLEDDDYVIDYEILSDGTLSVEVWRSEDDEYEHVTAAHILDFALNHTKENVGRRKNEE